MEIKQVGNLYGTERERNPVAGRVYDPHGICPTLRTPTGGGTIPLILIKQATSAGYAELIEGGVANLAYPNSKTRRGRVIDKGMTAPTLQTSSEICRIESTDRIRKLTPRECFRLQGWTDDYFEKAQLVNSDSQLYKQAGNGVTVTVIEAMANKMAILDQTQGEST